MPGLARPWWQAQCPAKNVANCYGCRRPRDRSWALTGGWADICPDAGGRGHAVPWTPHAVGPPHARAHVTVGLLVCCPRGAVTTLSAFHVAREKGGEAVCLGEAVGGLEQVGCDLLSGLGGGPREGQERALLLLSLPVRCATVLVTIIVCVFPRKHSSAGPPSPCPPVPCPGCELSQRKSVEKGRGGCRSPCRREHRWRP